MSKLDQILNVLNWRAKSIHSKLVGALLAILAAVGFYVGGPMGAFWGATLALVTTTAYSIWQLRKL